MEWYKNGDFHGCEVDDVIAACQTDYQKVFLAKSKFYGKILVIDEEIQSVERDEAFYHEAMVHPAAVMHPRPQTALIMGAGEGATARELLRINTIKKIVAVDVDKKVIDFSRKYMHSWHKGSLDNKKVELVIGDAKQYIQNTNSKFDIVISDLPTPMENGPACSLYKLEFYKKLKSIMTKDAVLSVQAGPLLPWQLDFHKIVYLRLKKVFEVSRSYFADVPSFHMLWSFVYAGKSSKDPLLKKFDFFDRVISNSLKGRLKSIDGLTLEGMFRLPKYYRHKLEKNTKLLQKKSFEKFKLFSVR